MSNMLTDIFVKKMIISNVKLEDRVNMYVELIIKDRVNLEDLLEFEKGLSQYDNSFTRRQTIKSKNHLYDLMHQYNFTYREIFKVAGIIE